MKKISVIIICSALLIACLIPTFALAAEQSDTAASVHLINPAAIAVMGDYLYVADNIEQNRTALLRFDIHDYSLSGTLEIPYSVSNLSTGNNSLYAVCGNTVAELKINGSNPLEITETFTFDETVVDFAYGSFTTASAYYALTNSGLLRFAQDDIDNGFDYVFPFTNTTSVNCLNLNGIYSLTTDSTAIIKYYGPNGNTPAVTFNMPAGFAPVGMFDWNNQVALYSANSIYYYVENPATNYVGQPLFTDVYTNEDNAKIVDVVAATDTLFVLNNQKKIDVYKQTDGGFDKANKVTIGTDSVSLDVPTEYTSYTLVRAKNYPANIIYKSTDENSVDGIITDATEYIVLGYDGDDQCPYFLAYVGGKFGWVKKSDGSNSIDDEVQAGKMEIIPTSVGTETVGYVAKFISLKTVYVYKLPNSSLTPTSFTQNADNMTEVKVLQKFTETLADGKTLDWYFVSYKENETGFVQSSAIGKFHAVGPNEGAPESSVYKINSSLFEAVKLYSTSQMTEYEVVYDENDNPVKLYSGSRVHVIERDEEKNASFVMVLHNDGTRDYGWLPTNRLIDTHKMTTNAIVGLSLLGFAVALTAVLLAVFLRRRKKIKANVE